MDIKGISNLLAYFLIGDMILERDLQYFPIRSHF